MCVILWCGGNDVDVFCGSDDVCHLWSAIVVIYVLFGDGGAGVLFCGMCVLFYDNLWW